MLKGIVLLNVIASFFVLYLMIRAVLTSRIRKKCEPIHKRPFQIKYQKTPWQDRITIIATLLMWGCWILGIIYYETVQMSFVYFAALVGMTTFYPLFRNGKIGEKGIAIADQFISWHGVADYELTWVPITDFQYPNGKLHVNTTEGKQYEIIVDKKYADEVTRLLESKQIEAGNRA